MMLRHPWLAPLLKPPSISDEDAELHQADDASVGNDSTEPGDSGSAAAAVIDKEVAMWARQALENRKNNKLGKKAKPALHAAPLNVLPA